MSTKKQVGSKLANSIRQAKEQQTQQAAAQAAPAATTEAAKPAAPVAAAAKTERMPEERVAYLQPSRRVWPD